MKYFIITGRLFDGVNETFWDNMKILVEDDKIVDVGVDLPCPADSEVLDLSHLTITPGLIDAHVHFDFVGPDVDGTPESLQLSNEMKAFSALYCAKEGLMGGFTTIRIIGGSHGGFGAIDAKRAIDAGMFPGARLVVAPNSLTTTGGHSDYSAAIRSNFRLSEAMERLIYPCGNWPDFFRKMVRSQAKYGADLIKIMATGGFSSPFDGPEDVQMSDEELMVIMRTAKALGLSVTAHAYESSLIKKLVGFGITGIEHGAMLDESAADMMKEHGTYLVPTFMPYEEIVNLDEEKLQKKTPLFRQKLEKYAAQLKESRKLIIRLIHENELTIGYGTDIVSVYDNFDCWREFKAWRDNGISALRTLKAATSINARILRRPQAGQIAPGFWADLSGFSGDMEQDHEVIIRCAFVMKGGIVYKF